MCYTYHIEMDKLDAITKSLVLDTSDFFNNIYYWKDV